MLLPILYLGVLLVAVIGLTIWPVKVLKRRIGNKAYWFAPAPLLVLLLVGFVVSRSGSPNNGPPKFLPSTALSGLISAQPDYAPFSYTGMAFYEGKLYVSTNVGMIEVDDGRVNGVYRFQSSDAVVSGPWLDTANQLLWSLDVHTNQFLNFDGIAWHRVNAPLPQKGYLTRGDVLEGPRAIGNRMGFWLEYGGSVWRWNASRSKWDVEKQPDVSSGSANAAKLIGVLPIGEELLFIERHQPLPFLVKEGEDFASDTIIARARGSYEIQNASGSKFLAEEWVVSDDAGYICARSGLVLKVTLQAITRLDAPASCETLSTTADRKLVASFHGKGIYEYGEGWKLRAAHPYPSGQGEYWTHLAEDGPVIALAVDGKPIVDKEHSSGTTMKFTRNAPTHFWVRQGAEFHSLEIP